MGPDSELAGRPTRVDIDLGCFRRNVQAVLNRLPEESKLIAVVKADAYGHGAVQIARECERLGLPMLLVVLVEEGIALRDAGIEMPILVSAALSSREVLAAIRHDLTLGVTTTEMLRHVINHVEDSNIPTKVHIKFDTGMGRLGILAEEIGDVVTLLASSNLVSIDGYYSHYASSFLADDPLTDEQDVHFAEILETMRGHGLEAPTHHIASSAGLARNLVSHGAWVRAGLSLYGCEPVEGSGSRLEPVMRWSTRVASIKDFPTGHRVGYGRTFTTACPSRIAVIPVGYADGYDRRFGNNAEVLIRGRRAPVVGAISMDVVTIDVTDIENAAIGDEVVLIGSQGEDEISADELASRIDTIPYEVLCRVGKRVSREHTDASRLTNQTDD